MSTSHAHIVQVIKEAQPRQLIRSPPRPNAATTEEALRCRLGSRPRPRDARHPHHHMVALVATYFIFRCCRHDSIALGQRACCATREEETTTEPKWLATESCFLRVCSLLFLRSTLPITTNAVVALAFAFVGASRGANKKQPLQKN